MTSGLRLPSLSRLHLSGCRLRAKPSASGSWPRLPGAVSGGNTQPVKEAVVKKPADNVTLSAAEGEAMIARLSVYAPSHSDCEMLIQVVGAVVFLAGVDRAGGEAEPQKAADVAVWPRPKAAHAVRA
jgi:hypothetical protein